MDKPQILNKIKKIAGKSCETETEGVEHRRRSAELKCEIWSSR